MITLAHWLLPSWLSWIVGGSTFVLILVAIGLAASGGSKAVSGFFEVLTDLLKPVAAALGNAFASFIQACVNGVPLIFANPQVLAPMLVVIAGLGSRYFLPQVVATQKAKAELAQCISTHKATPARKPALKHIK